MRHSAYLRAGQSKAQALVICRGLDDFLRCLLPDQAVEEFGNGLLLGAFSEAKPLRQFSQSVRSITTKF
jgi:hypothetical protein